MNDRPSKGMQALLNDIRSTSIENNTLYHKSVPLVNPTTPFMEWASPILNNKDVFNEFVPQLLERIVYTWVQNKTFSNPLRNLEGDEIPFGGKVQDIAINPAEGYEFDANDFAGLLAKYAPDVKVQYNEVNADWQFKVTTSEDNIRSAMTSWGNLYRFTEAAVNSLYNGYYINDFNTTKGLITSAYRENMVQVRTIGNPTDETSAKALIRQARGLYLNMQLPSTDYNAWNKVGGAGRALTIWSNPEDIVLFIRNDLLALIDVEVLSRAFNLNETNFMGRVYGVDNFDQYDRNGNKVYDGSKIVMAIGDRRWFRIHPQFIRMDYFFNAHNTSWQNFLRVRKMYQYSYFANMVVFATELPTVNATTASFNPATLTMSAGTTANVALNITPATTTNNVVLSVKQGNSKSTDITATYANGNVSLVATDTASGEYTINAEIGDVNAKLTVTVTEKA